MRKQLACMLFGLLISGCGQGTDSETDKLYQAYSEQYYGLKKHAFEERQVDAMLYENDTLSAAAKSLFTYIDQNDKRLENSLALDQPEIDRMREHFDSLLYKIQEYNYKLPILSRIAFPDITHKDSFITQAVEIRQSQLRLLKQGVYCSAFRWNKFPFYPKGYVNNFFPKFISTDTVGNRLQFSFLFGAYALGHSEIPYFKTQTLSTGAGADITPQQSIIHEAPNFIFIRSTYSSLVWTGTMYYRDYIQNKTVDHTITFATADHE